jgi:hypothetical protein
LRREARTEPFGKPGKLRPLDRREEPVVEVSVSGPDLESTSGGHNETTKICLGRQRNASTDRGMQGGIFSSHSKSLECLVVPGVILDAGKVYISCSVGATVV